MVCVPQLSLPPPLSFHILTGEKERTEVLFYLKYDFLSLPVPFIGAFLSLVGDEGLSALSLQLGETDLF